MKATKKELPWSLIIDKLSGEISPTDNDKLEAWLADEEHRDLFRSISAVWDSVQEEAARIQPDEERCWEIIAEKIGYEEKPMEQPKRSARARLLQMNRWTLAAACGALLIALSLFIHLLAGGTDVLPTYMAMDGKTKILLADSTVVWLRENSTVKSDKKHPFIVETKGLEVKVHGTKFNVVAEKEANSITVSLEEGSVELLEDSSEESTYLKPGEMADYNRETGDMTVTEGGENMNSWVSGNLDIRNASLAEIGRILSHHFDMDIHVDRSIGEKYHYTFQSHGESLKDLLEILTTINPIQYKYEDEHTVLITPK